MTREDGITAFYAPDRNTWRTWLTKNHSREKNVWLIIYKKTSKTKSVSYAEAVEEALCFGWVDSKPNRRDSQSYFQFFARRNPKSNWSTKNRNTVEKLIRAKLMTPSGLKAVKLARTAGTWDALSEVDAGQPPPDLVDALRRNRLAKKHFDAFPRSSKKIILEWILNAKRAETRAHRISETVRLAAQNLRANHFRQPKRAGDSV